MSFVNLVSGGLDSTLVGVMAKEDGIEHFPLFVDYGQRAAQKEWETCQAVHKKFGLPSPSRVDVSGFGSLVKSGLTDSELDINEDAFTPGRNLMFLLLGSAHAYQLGVSSVAIGLLSEELSLFPDQQRSFIDKATSTIESAMGRHIRLLTPLIEFTKADVVELAHSKSINGTYSCHTGDSGPCGRCIACLEYQFN